MRGTAEMLLWAWIILNSAASSVILPEITDQKFIDECVREHNKARSSVSPAASDMQYMTWDMGLAITARAWAKRCMFEHNIYLKEVHRVHPVFPSVGENIWTANLPSLFSVTRAMESWINETKVYNYQSNTCSDICGHYTQIVWASSYKVGCAVQLCPNGVRLFTSSEGVIFVCNYAPAGNMATERPYNSQGEPCSRCNSTCEEKLCRSQERDAQRSYNWTPDWDLTSSIQPKYVTFLIVRPVALFFTFLTAYAVHYKYPNSFCYE